MHPVVGGKHLVVARYLFFALFCDVTKLIVPVTEPTMSEHLGSCTEFWCLKDFYVTAYFLLCMQVKSVEDTYN